MGIRNPQNNDIMVLESINVKKTSSIYHFKYQFSQTLSVAITIIRGYADVALR